MSFALSCSLPLLHAAAAAPVQSEITKLQPYGGLDASMDEDHASGFAETAQAQARLIDNLESDIGRLHAEIKRMRDKVCGKGACTLDTMPYHTRHALFVRNARALYDACVLSSIVAQPLLFEYNHLARYGQPQTAVWVISYTSPRRHTLCDATHT